MDENKDVPDREVVVVLDRSVHSEDIVHAAIEDAVKQFGDRGDGLFTSAGFGSAFRCRCGMKTGIDGEYVRGILSGRSDVQFLSGGDHFRMVPAVEYEGSVSGCVAWCAIMAFAVVGMMVTIAFAFVCAQVAFYG